MHKSSIKVHVRIRPMLPMDYNSTKNHKSVKKINDSTLVLTKPARVRATTPVSRGMNAESMGYLRGNQMNRSGNISVRRNVLENSSVKSNMVEYSFSNVFDEFDSQQEIFENTCLDLIELSASTPESNSSVICYGATGSGKTHSVTGGTVYKAGIPSSTSSYTPLLYDPDPGANTGLIIKTFEAIFQIKSMERSPTSFYLDIRSVYLYTVELYNNQVYDLIEGVHSHQCLSKEVKSLDSELMAGILEPFSKTEIESPEQAFECIVKVSRLRAVAATNCNKSSSRSHLLLVIELAYAGGSNYVAFADLAGSERLQCSGARGETLVETQHINKSLSALSSVIFALEHGHRHVPFRDSKLTRLLRPCLHNSHAAFIAHVAPCATHESGNTLLFATRLKSVALATPACSNATSTHYTQQLEAHTKLCAEHRVLRAVHNLRLSITQTGRLALTRVNEPQFSEAKVKAAVSALVDTAKGQLSRTLSNEEIHLDQQNAQLAQLKEQVAKSQQTYLALIDKLTRDIRRQEYHLAILTQTSKHLVDQIRMRQHINKGLAVLNDHLQSRPNYSTASLLKNADTQCNIQECVRLIDKITKSKLDRLNMLTS